MSFKFRGPPLYLSGLTLMAAGLLLSGAGIAYFFYSWVAHLNLDIHNVSSLESESAVASDGLYTTRPPQELEPPTNLSAAPPLTTLSLSHDAIAAQTLYPGELLNPSLWNNPLIQDVFKATPSFPLHEFKTIDIDDVPLPHTLPPPIRITIPAVGVDSVVEGLRLLDVANNREYETPNNVVGHIPTTSNAGELGTGWYFGHLESPIRGEGSVFSQLPKIPRLLRRGVPVYVTIENRDSVFLYRLSSSKVVHEDELTLHEIGGASISLVTCIPRLIYDYRLIVAGDLVAAKDR